jgi:hypothetical protein
MTCRRGFEDRWATGLLTPPGPYLLRGYGDSHNLRIAESAHLLPTIFDFGLTTENLEPTKQIS